MRILGRITSINVRKVLWCADEVAAVYAHEDQWAGAASARLPEFLALNPNGLVPVLEDEGGVLWESNTICRYLAGKHGRHDLLPNDPRARALVEMWMDWQAPELNGAWRYPFMALVRLDPAYDDPEGIAAGARQWNEMMRILEDRLAATGAYVAGPRFTLADIVIGLSAHRWRQTPIERPDYPAVAAWLLRLEERPGFRRYASPATP